MEDDAIKNNHEENAKPNKGKLRNKYKNMKGEVLFKGWLRKRPRISGYWRKRYFILTEYEEGKLILFF